MQGGLLRGGEKDTASKTFVPIGSSYRNHLWGPSGVPLVVERQVHVSDSARTSAQQTYEAVCTRVLQAPPPAEVIDRWLTGFTDGRYQDLVYPPAGMPVEDVAALAAILIAP
jgi:chondroitin AC lyase